MNRQPVQDSEAIKQLWDRANKSDDRFRVVEGKYDENIKISDLIASIPKEARGAFVYRSPVVFDGINLKIKDTVGLWKKNKTDIYFDTGNVGVGTDDPFNNVGTTAGDFSGTGIHIKGVGWTRIILEGNAVTFNLCDTAGAVNDKLMTYIVNAGRAEFGSVNDDLTARVPNILVMDMGTGFVGIGTTAPAELLHVHSASTHARIEVSSATDNAKIRLDAPADEFAGYQWYTGATYDWTIQRPANQTYLEIASATVSNIMVLERATGNVGIGAVPTLKMSVSEKIGMTPLGGLANRMTNKTGVASVAGKLVKADTATDDAFILSGADEQECIGVIYESGIADGAECWIVVEGIADVMMKNNTAATHGYWVKASDEAGYADATNAAPPGGGVVQIDEHMREVGHCIESVLAGGVGTHILARVKLHFN